LRLQDKSGSQGTTLELEARNVLGGVHGFLLLKKLL
jgi:hypothetical protein